MGAIVSLAQFNSLQPLFAGCRVCCADDSIRIVRALDLDGEICNAQPKSVLSDRLEKLLEELFRLHDLKGNDVLEELELIKLNEKIAMLHYGKHVNREEVKTKYKKLFRSKLDPNGQPVPYQTFQRYMADILKELDPDIAAQEMILESWISEAESGRAAFHCMSLVSMSDQQFIAKIPFRSDMVFGTKLVETPSPTARHVSAG